MVALVLAAASAASLVAPERFAGFGGDSRQFAFSAFSQGAGVPTVTFVRCRDGQVEKVVAIHDAASRTEAERLLAEGRFSDQSRPAPSWIDRSYTLEARIGAAGRVELTLRRRSDGRAKEIYRAPPSSPAATDLSLWGFSPDGRCAAFRETLGPTTEFGAKSTYVVVDVGRAAAALSRPLKPSSAPPPRSAAGSHATANPDRQ